MLRIAIADDHQLFRKSLAFLLNSFEGMEVVIEARNGREMLEKLDKTPADIALLDIQMPIMNGYDTCEAIVTRYKHMKVMMISQVDSGDSISRVMKLGAHGYFTKNSDPEQLKYAIQSLNGRGFYFEQELGFVLRQLIVGEAAGERMDEALLLEGEDLTEREVEIIWLTCKGLNSQEIADKIFLTARTVEGHKSRLMERLDVKNFVGVILYALRRKYITLEELFA